MNIYQNTLIKSTSSLELRYPAHSHMEYTSAPFF